MREQSGFGWGGGGSNICHCEDLGECVWVRAEGKITKGRRGEMGTLDRNGLDWILYVYLFKYSLYSIGYIHLYQVDKCESKAKNKRGTQRRFCLACL